MGKAHGLFRSRERVVLFVYLILLISSHLVQMFSGGMNDSLLPGRDRPSIEIANRGDDGEIITGDMLRLVYQRWGPSTQDHSGTRTPVLLMHGAPGMGTDFARLGGLLTTDNRAVYSPDLIGFAQSGMGDNVSYRVQAKHMFSFLDSMGVDRVHLVGWSNGGGVGLRMADLYPERVASLTMLASVGSQESEGSGSYFFEHVKYAVGIAFVGYLPEIVPHFGILGTHDLRVGWLWSFWDSDQRDLTEIMPTIETPVMILHGRDDFLVMDWAAELHHEMMPTSKLVMLDASHFLPFMQARETAGYLNAFFDRHDQEGVAPETGYLDLAPKPVRSGVDAALHWIGDQVRSLPWWLQLIAVIVVVWRVVSFGLVITMMGVSLFGVDFGVAILGMMSGRALWLWCSAGVLDRPRTAWGWVRGVAYIVPVHFVGLVGGLWTLGLTFEYGLFGLVFGCGLLWSAFVFMRLVVTWEGRQRIKAAIERVMNHEYWATWILYIPVSWWGIKWILSGKGIRTLGAVNPGYANDGGVQGESKIDINSKLGNDQAILKCVLIDDDDNIDRRIARAIDVVETDTEIGGLPVICKPDVGEHGVGVQLAKSMKEVAEYSRMQPDAFVIQKFHPGVCEVGVLWTRNIESIKQPEWDGSTGDIYAITVKHFPSVIGDGKRTVRQLILQDRRHRRQAAMFIERMMDQSSLVPGDGETFSLGFAGNHAQGAMFCDGSELNTPALKERIEQIVCGFCDDNGRGFDIGRFDLRCDSLEALAHGEGFGIVELNGVASEPTNLYDPDRSIIWAWRLLGGYWKRVGLIAQARIKTGTGEAVDRSTWAKLRRAYIRTMFPF